MPTLIYDFGMNNGDDVQYYLLKGFSVIAVEANPQLCDRAAHRFAGHIAGGRVKILNVALADATSSVPLTFYIHRQNHVLSQLAVPDDLDAFEAISVPRRKASEIVQEHGPAHYIKIDVEGMDAVVLADLFAAGIAPEFISAEMHSVHVFTQLVGQGYQSFSLVNGATVHDDYADATIGTMNAPVRYSFPKHSAGPFGDDIRTSWRNADAFVSVMAAEGFGWKDVHASWTIRPNAGAVRPVLELREHLRDLAPSVARWCAAKWRRRLG